MGKGDITIIVNSCDKYSDLWYPFFELFSIQWPNCPYKIILNTESKSYTHPKKVGEGITCLQLYQEGANVDWSTRLLETLKFVKTKFVLMILDDEFIQEPVDEKKFYEVLSLLRKDIFVPYISLSSCFNGLYRNATSSKIYKNLDALCYAFYSFHAANCAIWRTRRLKRYLKKGENPWEFEVNCKARSSIFERHYVIKDGYYPIRVSYSFFAGIGMARGKWLCDTPKLFEQHNIKTDFNLRGVWHKFLIDFSVKDELEIPFAKRFRGYLDFIKEYKIPRWIHVISCKIKRKFGKRF